MHYSDPQKCCVSGRLFLSLCVTNEMLDREARNILTEQIRHFIAGLSDNFKFDDVIFDIKTNDLAVIEIRKQLWHTYDDLTRHKLTGKWTLSDKDMDIVKRFIIFLKTDQECEKPSKNTDWNVWPFADEEQKSDAMSSPKYLNNAR